VCFCICVSVRVGVCACGCARLCVRMSTWKNAAIQMHIGMFICTCMYTCIQKINAFLSSHTRAIYTVAARDNEHVDRLAVFVSYADNHGVGLCEKT